MQDENHDFDSIIRDSVKQVEDAKKAAVPSVPGFENLRLIGSGAMGAVYQAEQVSPSRVVALKVIHAGRMSAKGLRRFGTESNVLGQLQHEGIAKIYLTGSARIGGEARPFFAMEFISGPTLKQLCKPNSRTIRQKLILFCRICDAVQHAHQRTIIHRDLKPANIIVSEGDLPRIVDFGVVRFIKLGPPGSERHEETQTGEIVGTYEYMSPEQIMGRTEEISTQSDVYSLGVVLYELLTGELPYKVRGKSLPQVQQAVCNSEPQKRPPVDGDLATIVAKAMEKEPSRRYASSAELAADIRRYLNDEPIQAKPASLAYRLRLIYKRRPWTVTLSALTILALGSAAYFASMQANAENRQKLQEKEHKLELERARYDAMRRRLVSMKPSPEPDQERTLKIRQPGGRWRDLYRFERDFSASDGVVFDSGEPGTGDLFAFALTHSMINDEGSTLCAFDLDKSIQIEDRMRWHLSLSDKSRWPDCQHVIHWYAQQLWAGNYLESRGEEILVRANHPHNYPARIALVSATGKIARNFWHPGHLQTFIPIPRFFDDGREAVLIWGFNNRLGTTEPTSRSTPLSEWTMVPVVAILDPAKMAGGAPPATDFGGLVAYAMLNRPYEQTVGNIRLVDNKWKTIHEAYAPDEMAQIEEVEVPDDPDQQIQVEVLRQDGESATLLLNQSLQIVDILEKDVDIQFWKKHWVVLVQNDEVRTQDPGSK